MTGKAETARAKLAGLQRTVEELQALVKALEERVATIETLQHDPYAPRLVYLVPVALR